MGRCSECRTHLWFRKICHRCENRLRLLEREGFSRAQGGRDFHKTIIRESSSTRLSIVINGKPVHVPPGEGLTRDVLQRLAVELEIPVDEVEGLVSGALEEAAATTHVGDLASVPVNGPLRKVDCPGCERTVPARQGWCMYCGHELEIGTATGHVAREDDIHEVDRKFLETDVTETERDDQAREVTRDSYRDRLNDL